MNYPVDAWKPTARIRGIVVQELSGEVLVYDMDTDQAHCLNESAAIVWKACDGSNTVSNIIRQFESVGLGKVTEDFVWLAIDQLNENGLMENEIAPRFTIQSRRQVLKTIGLVSVVALPVVASLLAPKRAYGVGSCWCINSFDCSRPQNAGCPSTTNCNSFGLCAPNPPSQRGTK